MQLSSYLSLLWHLLYRCIWQDVRCTCKCPEFYLVLFSTCFLVTTSDVSSPSCSHSKVFCRFLSNYVSRAWMLRECYVSVTWMLRECYVNVTGCYTTFIFTNLCEVFTLQQVHMGSGDNCLNFEDGHGARVIDTCPFTANKTQRVLCEGESQVQNTPEQNIGHPCCFLEK